MGRSLLSLALLLMAGCATEYTLRMPPAPEPKDNAVVAKAFEEKPFKKFIIIPASGVAGGEYERVVTFLERELLKRNIQLISSAVSGRVVEDKTGAGEKKNERAIPLSDTERLFVMAKKTGADAILQIGSLRWESAACGLFVLNKKGEDQTFEQVGPAEFEAWAGPKISISCPMLHFTGRLMDVENGVIMVSLSYSIPAACELPRDYVATYKLKSHSPILTSENFKVGAGAVVWIEAKEKVLDKVLTAVAHRLLRE